MFRHLSKLSVVCLALASLVGTASAASWTPDQQEIWKFEEQQWQMSRDKDDSWIDKMVHANLSYWETGQAMPQDKASLARWNRYGNSNSTVLEQELYPISITITGNVAVVQYYYRVARENYKKEREAATGRYTDVLLKEGSGWRFIAWAGGDDPKK
jgi:hypothetical protein